MGRDILYLVETDAGNLRVIERGSSAMHAPEASVRIDLLPEDSLVFDAATEKLMSGARVSPPA